MIELYHFVLIIKVLNYKLCKLKYLKKKELATTENKAYNEFSVSGGHEQENKTLVKWFTAFSASQLSISEARMVYVC